MREEFTELFPVFAELFELMLGPEADQFLTLQLGNLLAFGERLRHGFAIEFRQLGLVVKRLQMRRATCLVEEDDPLRFSRMVEWVHNTL